MEFAVTLKALKTYLPPPPARVIDIGGGPGRYAIELTRWGYQVTLLDLSAGCLEIAAQKSAEAGVRLHEIIQANALDLAELKLGEFEAALLCGPLYHLLQAEERKKALQATTDVLKPSGLLFAAFITRFAPFRRALSQDPEWLVRLPDYTRSVLDTGVHNQGKTFPQAYFTHPDEIELFMSQAGFEKLNLIGCEGIVAENEREINNLQGEAWQAWVDLNFELGQDPSLYGAADHLLFVGRKPG
jgi:ubiquinone/menaquinone biosynthesis C-methylase UbiE